MDTSSVPWDGQSKNATITTIEHIDQQEIYLRLRPGNTPPHATTSKVKHRGKALQGKGKKGTLAWRQNLQVHTIMHPVGTVHLLLKGINDSTAETLHRGRLEQRRHVQIPCIGCRFPSTMGSNDEVPNAGPCTAVLLVHGLFLAICGCVGAASHGWTKKVMHSAYAGLGGMFALMVCAGLVASGSRKPFFIGVHIGLVLQLVFVIVFSLQTYKSWGNPEKADRVPLFIVMGVGSAIGLGLMVAFKPKKKKDAP
mmetsp:Transcript_46276/g.91726  ORF Transcript_46276/g.91726 Transcript_46276/m.91726 type:complete len:253 (-) Transcript_46276:101-859(-)|eukprot:CAMPEP_0172893482 /NCGR_PEP_ID=MMETSP1075-20121228/148622_1 /TAXON_ID=2916 /ORGANISM="Ceratium fusus, Strain PA161109" /LENGTH=252 /DNA_ID=CAMNT_0013748355 /DNA_START=70 /DNA_END=828 /DNA_ORIENTATION=+